MNAVGRGRTGWRVALAGALITGGVVAGGLAYPSAVSAAPPVFTKVFAPDTIGPGSSTTLTFNIDNTAEAVPADNLAFSDTLPSGVVIAPAPRATTTCGAAGATITAPAGGSTISFAGGSVGASSSCTVRVDVTGTAVGTHTNTSGDLTSDGGNSGTATDDLMVVDSLPGFTKVFSPSSVPFGDRSTLTLIVDNTANASSVPNLDFTDTLPPGLEIADPADASTDCGDPSVPPTLTADPGSSSIILDADGTLAFPAVAAGASCSVVVDVVTSAVGTLANSSELFAEFVSAGNANAAITVTRTELALTKEFTDDPVPPGGTVTLEFTILNSNRTDAATDVAFDDNLPAGLTFDSLLSNDCGGTLDTSTPSVLSFSGGTVAAETTCALRVSLTVPAGSAPGSYVNTTTAVTGTIGGSVTGNAASDTLFVVSFPLLTKEFTDDPVGAGGDVTLEFTITNTDPTNAMTDITFLDELTDGSGGFPPDTTSGFLPFPVSVTLPPVPDPPCGGGSSLALVSRGTDRQALELTGGDLPGGGSCTFSVTVTIPDGFPGGTYSNTTETISGVVSGTTMVGPEASDDIVVLSAPMLSKEFTDDPVDPGSSVTLEFTLDYDAFATADATAIAFSDDLDATLTGLTAASVDSNDCGATVDITTDPSLVDVSGGTLTPGASCTIVLTLSVPGTATPGSHTNTTSTVTATVSGAATTGLAAEDDLQISAVVLTKEFLENPYIAGEAGTLRFTIDNQTAEDATITSFADDLDATLSGLSAVAPPTSDTCGGTLTSTPSGSGSFLTYIGGAVSAGTSCTIDVAILVPAGAPDGTFSNVTSSLSYVLATSGSQVSDPAVDDLVVDSSIIAITKSFTDDPTLPGGTVTLSFDLTNLSAADTIEDIAFDDDLGAALAGLTATGATNNTCGGMATSAFPTTLFQYAGGTLGPGASCNITLTVAVPSAPLPGTTFTNTTTAPTGIVDPSGAALPVGGDPASDDLVVRSLTLTKSFDGPTGATGTAQLEFTITNLDPAGGVGGLSFTDDLEAVLSGLVASTLPTNPCGAGSAITGTSVLSFTGGTLAAAGSSGDSCTFAVTVDVPGTATPGTYPNTTSQLFSGAAPVGTPATASLVIEPAPTFAKAFTPDSIAQGANSTLTFTIDNTASAIAATNLAFTDSFPAGVVVAAPPNAAGTCTGGTVTAVAGSGSVSYAGGSVAAGASCTVAVDVTGTTTGVKNNVSGDLTSSSGNSGTASDTLTVTAAPAPSADISVSKTDGVTSVVPGSGTDVVYTIVVSNAGPSADPAVSVADTFPAGLTCSYTSSAAGGATGNTASGSGNIADTLNMPSGSSVTYTATCAVGANATGTLSNTATATSSVSDPNTANNSATDTTSLAPEADLSITKDDGRTTALAGQNALVYTIRVSNAGPSPDPAARVVDNFPALLTCTWTSVAAGGASGNSASGSGNIDDTVNLPVGSSVTYTATCSTALTASGTISNTATVSASVTDPNTSNNSATDSNTQLRPPQGLPATGGEAGGLVQGALLALVAGLGLWVLTRLPRRQTVRIASSKRRSRG